MVKPRTLTLVPLLTEAVRARFWSKVQKADGCWNWIPEPKRKYGRFKVAHLNVLAHRVAYSIGTGLEVPDGLLVCHRCDNPRCVRPDHFFLGTQLDNIRDAVAKKRHAFGDRSSSRLYPEKLARGDRNGSRKHPERLRRGEQVNTAKITAADVVEIRRRRATGEFEKDLAKAFGITQAVVSKICLRQLWKHVA